MKTIFDKHGEILDNFGASLRQTWDSFRQIGDFFSTDIGQKKRVFDKRGHVSTITGHFSTNMGKDIGNRAHIRFSTNTGESRVVTFRTFFDKSECSASPLNSTIQHVLFDTSSRSFRQIGTLVLINYWYSTKIFT